MKESRTLSLILCIAFAASSIVFGAKLANKKPTIPAIAKIAGITVGKDTMETLEKRLGPGLKYTGGHPNGGRVWYIKPRGVYVCADGFDYSKNGRLVQSVFISFDVHDLQLQKPIPNVRLGKKLCWMNGITLGMRKTEVLKRTRTLPKPESYLETFSWTMEGSCNGQPARWVAELEFVKGRLYSINVWSW